MKNTLTDLNNHLYAQLERLGNEDITPEQLAAEMDRTKAITVISREVMDNARLVLEAEKLRTEDRVQTLPDLLGFDQK